MPFHLRLLGLLLGALMVLVQPGSAAAEVPAWLPCYDLDVKLDVDRHTAHVREQVTWTNRHQRPTSELVFNAHLNYRIPDDQVGFLAKTVEILRMRASETMDFHGPALDLHKITLNGSDLPFHFREDNRTALVLSLPKPVGPGESVTVVIEFTFWLPQKQGRWGQWEGVTFLAQWLPVLAYFDEGDWQPTPFIPWHQPFLNEAGIYSARVRLPKDQELACSGTIQSVRDLGDGWKQVEIVANGVRDFALVCSARFQEFTGQAGPVRVRCLAFPEHAHYAEVMVRIACEAIATYSAWIGPYPYADFTLAESFFGWNGNECGGLVMIDERIFGVPHVAEGFVEYLIAHEVCHQWFYNLIGTNGYCETWMDEGPATYFSHRLINGKHGKNNPLLKLPRGLGWLPNIHREDYRHYGLCGTIGRGEVGPTLRPLDQFDHVVNVFSMTYDKGYRIVGLMEARLGETAFFDFMRLIYRKYQYRILRVQDLKTELEAYTGQSWEEFFRFWLYGPGITDWSIEKVSVDRSPLSEVSCGPAPPCNGPRTTDHGRLYKVTVLLKQKGDCCEPTTLGICADGGEGFQIRIPIHPEMPVLEVDDPPARVEMQPNGRMKVEVLLPSKPTQIAVDPDQLLVDSEPANNYWKPKIRWRLTPLYTPLEETDLTNSYDRWNIIAGPWLYGQAYNDPWYTRSTMAGLRLGAYRTQQCYAGAYLGYRTDYRDLAAGVDIVKQHWPWPHTEVGFNAERSVTQFSDNQATADRGVLYGRYIFQYGSSLYLPPMQYAELFGTVQNHYLPWSATMVSGAERADHQTAVGVHYHKDYMTPYWDPEGGYRFDVTYANGLPIWGNEEPFNQVTARVAMVKTLPEWTGNWLSQTRLAGQLYGAAGFPDQAQYFSLGGSQLLRGFDLAERQGSTVWVASLEWRVPLMKDLHWDCCDHTVGLRNVYLAAFYDVGDAYLKGQSLGPVAHSVGGGLRLDVAWFSFIERTILRLDVAKAVNADAPVQYWFGVQHPF